MKNSTDECYQTQYKNGRELVFRKTDQRRTSLKYLEGQKDEKKKDDWRYIKNSKMVLPNDTI